MWVSVLSSSRQAQGSGPGESQEPHSVAFELGDFPAVFSVNDDGFRRACLGPGAADCLRGLGGFLEVWEFVDYLGR